ncbi:hypothetical protein AB0M35_12315 [Micromonospora sp. NPDC051196]|uniref:hypothetical protein n=1 Tax=Micromonospora sp. NPDC051196 TaxID=3155281 RepID=UPI0034435573
MWRPARSLVAAAVMIGWTTAGLALALVVLDAGRYEGYRPEPAELTAAAKVLAIGTAVVAGHHGRVSGLRGALLRVLVVAVGTATLFLVGNALLYRYVVPLGASLDIARTWATTVGWTMLAGALGVGAGAAWRAATGPADVGPRSGEGRSRAGPVDVGPPGSSFWVRRWWVVGGLIGLAGLFVVPEFVRVGAELSVVRFVPADAVAVDRGRRVPVRVSEGRHAVFRSYAPEVSTRQCTIVDQDGNELALSAPAVPFTDNNDSIVTVLLGTFEAPRSGPVFVTCHADGHVDHLVAGLPETRGPLVRLVYAPAALVNGIGVLPGVLVGAGILAYRHRHRRTGVTSPG